MDGIETQIKAIETKADKAEVETLQKPNLTEIKDAAAKNQPVIDAFVSEGKRVKAPKAEVKTFNEILGEAIETNKERIQSARPGEFSEANPLRIPLMPELKQEGQKPIEVKVVGDMTASQ